MSDKRRDLAMPSGGLTGRISILRLNVSYSFQTTKAGNRTFHSRLTVNLLSKECLLFSHIFDPPSSSRPASLLAGGSHLWILSHFGCQICQPPPREEDETVGEDVKICGSSHLPIITPLTMRCHPLGGVKCRPPS